jgi:hypothetical protein
MGFARHFGKDAAAASAGIDRDRPQKLSLLCRNDGASCVLRLAARDHPGAGGKINDGEILSRRIAQIGGHPGIG